jgi:hypothetical protein
MDSRAESKAKRQGRRCSDTTGGRRPRVTAALGVHQMALGCPPASRARLRTPQLQQASTRAAVVVVWALPQTTAHPCCLYLRAERGTHFEETIESAHEIRWGWDYLGLAAPFPISRHRGRAGSSGGRRPGCGHCGVWWPSRRWDYLRYVSPSFHGEHERPEIDGHQLGHHRSSP